MTVLASWISAFLLSTGASATISSGDSAQVNLPKLTSVHQKALLDDNIDLVLSLSDFQLEGPVSGSWEVLISKPGDANCSKGKSQIVGVFSTFDLTPQTEFSFPLEPAIKGMNADRYIVSIRPISGMENATNPDASAGSITVESIEIMTVPRT